MLITPDYCRLMARYNAWQNHGLRRLIEPASAEVLMQDRGAFFGSILGTLNHLVWADRVWLARFQGATLPPGKIADSPHVRPTAAAWGAERVRTDARLTLWAGTLGADDLSGDLTWLSGAVGRAVSRQMDMLVVHMFNHQTHHRGQVHAMLTAAGLRPQDTDLFLMPSSPET